MQIKICCLAVVSALSMVSMRTEAYQYDIYNGDGPFVDMNDHIGTTTLSIDANPSMNYTVINVDNLDSLQLYPGATSTIVGKDGASRPYISNVDTNGPVTATLSNLDITNMSIGYGSNITFGKNGGLYTDGGRLNAVLSDGTLTIGSDTPTILSSNRSDYRTEVLSINMQNNNVNVTTTGSLSISDAYVNALVLGGGWGVQNTDAYINGNTYVDNININEARLSVQGNNYIDFLVLNEKGHVAIEDNTQIRSSYFIHPESALLLGSSTALDAIKNGSTVENVMPQLGGVTNGRAVEFNVDSSGNYGKLVLVEGNVAGAGVQATVSTAADGITPIYNMAIINATDATQTAIILNGSGMTGKDTNNLTGNIDLLAIDDNYIDENDYNAHTIDNLRFDSTYWAGGINSSVASRKQNLLNVTEDATLLEVSGDNNHFNINQDMSGQGWDRGGLKLTGNDNGIYVTNSFYRGFMVMSGERNYIGLKDFDYISSITADDYTDGVSPKNSIYLDSKSSTEGLDVLLGDQNIGVAGKRIDNISGDLNVYVSSWGDDSWVTLHDAKAKGDYTLDVGMVTLYTGQLSLNRTDSSVTGTLSDRDTFTIAGNLRTYGDSAIRKSNVDMGSGRNTDFRVNGYLEVYSHDPLYFNNFSISLDENTGDHIYVGGDLRSDGDGDLYINVDKLEGVGHGNDRIEIISAPNDIPDVGDILSVHLIGDDITYNALTGFYTLGASPYAWSFGQEVGGYYLSNIFEDNTPVFTPSVNASIAAPLAATHFLGANISQSFANYLQATPLGISHGPEGSSNMWGQYVYQKQQQDVIGGLSYASKMTGWDIGLDVLNQADAKWGLAASYRSLSNDLTVDVAGVSDTNTQMDAILVSAYGTKIKDNHVVDGQVYVGQAWARHNMLGEGRQEKDKGLMWGGYGQYGYRIPLFDNLTVTPTVGLNYHETQWNNTSISDGHNRYTRMYLELPLGGQTDNGLTWSIAPRYSYNFNAQSNVHISGVTDPVKTADMRHEYGLSATLTQKTDRNGTWYIQLSNDQLKDGDRTNLTVGGSWNF